MAQKIVLVEVPCKLGIQVLLVNVYVGAFGEKQKRRPKKAATS